MNTSSSSSIRAIISHPTQDSDMVYQQQSDQMPNCPSTSHDESCILDQLMMNDDSDFEDEKLTNWQPSSSFTPTSPKESPTNSTSIAVEQPADDQRPPRRERPVFTGRPSRRRNQAAFSRPKPYRITNSRRRSNAAKDSSSRHDRTSPSSATCSHQQSSQYFPRKVYIHQPKVGALCIDRDGYTISDGRITISEDYLEPDWDNRLARDIEHLELQKVYLVDDVTNQKFQSMKCTPRAVGVRNLRNLAIIHEEEPEERRQFHKCKQCGQIRCHRWRAIEYGVQRLFNYAIDPVPH